MLFAELHNGYKMDSPIPVYNNEFNEQVQSIVKQLISNDAVRQLMLSFISNTNRKHYIDHFAIAYFERNYFHTRQLSPYRANMLLSDENFKNYRHCTGYENYFGDGVTEFAVNDVDKLIKLLIKKHNLGDNIETLQAAYIALMHLSKGYFTEVAQDEIGTYFKNTEYDSVEDYVEAFCSIDSLNINDRCIRNLLALYLIQRHKMSYDSHYTDCFFEIEKLIEAQKEENSLMSYEKKLLQPKNKITYSINDVDFMNGSDFEHFVALLFTKMGYETTVTKGSGDQGIDVIAEKNNVKIGIQAKCYAGSVSNSAIQEVVAGAQHYGCDKSIVVTNNVFSKSAIELAQSNNVILWDRTILKDKIIEVFC